MQFYARPYLPFPRGDYADGPLNPHGAAEPSRA